MALDTKFEKVVVGLLVLGVLVRIVFEDEMKDFVSTLDILSLYLLRLALNGASTSTDLS